MNFISSVGAFLLGLSQLLLVYIVVKCVRSGPRATGQVWEGAQGLEFTLPSPPPYHTFETPPVVK
jgi:cytochrome c oxidase subunit 1